MGQLRKWVWIENLVLDYVTGIYFVTARTPLLWVYIESEEQNTLRAYVSPHTSDVLLQVNS